VEFDVTPGRLTTFVLRPRPVRPVRGVFAAEGGCARPLLLIVNPPRASTSAPTPANVPTPGAPRRQPPLRAGNRATAPPSSSRRPTCSAWSSRKAGVQAATGSSARRAPRTTGTKAAWFSTKKNKTHPHPSCPPRTPLKSNPIPAVNRVVAIPIAVGQRCGCALADPPVRFRTDLPTTTPGCHRAQLGQVGAARRLASISCSNQWWLANGLLRHPSAGRHLLKTSSAVEAALRQELCASLRASTGEVVAIRSSVPARSCSRSGRSRSAAGSSRSVLTVSRVRPVRRAQRL